MNHMLDGWRDWFIAVAHKPLAELTLLDVAGFTATVVLLLILAITIIIGLCAQIQADRAAKAAKKKTW